jgi:2-C-methyl-D-erythritol 2,4-cyclodiphosphate synthase
VLLAAVRDKLDAAGFCIHNVDATIIAQAPKMRPHIDKMRRNIADALMIPINTVNVKATTEEKLGFTGRGEGIAAEAVASIIKD